MTYNNPSHAKGNAAVKSLLRWKCDLLRLRPNNPMNNTMHRPAILAALCSFCMPILAADSSSDGKDQYTLFNPTPADSLRPLSSDRIGGAGNPFTVDAGHVQIESDLVNWYTYIQRGTFPNGTTYDYYEQELSWSPTIKLGLCNSADFEVSPSYVDHSWHQTGLAAPILAPYTTSYSHQYFSDTDVGFKINFWGNDGGLTALGISPYVGIPSRRGDIEGGASVPFAVRLPMHFAVKYSLGVEAIDTGGHVIHGELVNDLGISKTFARKFTAFWSLEVLAKSQSSTGWWGYTGFGAAYKFTPNFECYAAIRWGLGQAYDLNPSCGITWRY
jgi:hypothetical protein